MEQYKHPERLKNLKNAINRLTENLGPKATFENPDLIAGSDADLLKAQKANLQRPDGTTDEEWRRIVARYINM